MTSSQVWTVISSWEGLHYHIWQGCISLLNEAWLDCVWLERIYILSMGAEFMVLTYSWICHQKGYISSFGDFSVFQVFPKPVRVTFRWTCGKKLLGKFERQDRFIKLSQVKPQRKDKLAYIATAFVLHHYSNTIFVHWKSVERSNRPCWSGPALPQILIFKYAGLTVVSG